MLFSNHKSVVVFSDNALHTTINQNRDPQEDTGAKDKRLAAQATYYAEEQRSDRVKSRRFFLTQGNLI